MSLFAAGIKKVTNDPAVRHFYLHQRIGRDTRFPASLLKNLHLAGSFVRRCFARVLLLMNLVGEESPRCLTLFADADIRLVFQGCRCPKGRSLWGGWTTLSPHL